MGLPRGRTCARFLVALPTGVSGRSLRQQLQICASIPFISSVFLGGTGLVGRSVRIGGYVPNVVLVKSRKRAEKKAGLAAGCFISREFFKGSLLRPVPQRMCAARVSDRIAVRLLAERSER